MILLCGVFLKPLLPVKGMEQRRKAYLAPPIDTGSDMANSIFRKAATIISVLFHPLLMVTYMTAMLLIINPYQFGVFSIVEQWKLLLLVFMSTFAMPAFAVVLMRALNMISSFEMPDPKERIGPYIITGVFYLWMFINFKHNPTIPKTLTIGMLGATIALFASFFFNNFTKVSAHAAGIGGLMGVAAINYLYFNFDTFTLHLGSLGLFEISTSFVLVLLILLAGIVGTARLVLNAHTPGQLYGGFFIGVASQFIALAVLA